MTVYIVVYLNYGDQGYEVEKVFFKREDAEAYVNAKGSNAYERQYWQIDEWVVNGL